MVDSETERYGQDRSDEEQSQQKIECEDKMQDDWQHSVCSKLSTMVGQSYSRLKQKADREGSRFFVCLTPPYIYIYE